MYYRNLKKHSKIYFAAISKQAKQDDQLIVSVVSSPKLKF